MLKCPYCEKFTQNEVICDGCGTNFEKQRAAVASATKMSPDDLRAIVQRPEHFTPEQVAAAKKQLGLAKNDDMRAIWTAIENKRRGEFKEVGDVQTEIAKFKAKRGCFDFVKYMIIFIGCCFAFLFLWNLEHANDNSADQITIPLSFPEPEYIKDVHAQEEGKDGVLVYFTLADKSGTMVPADGSVDMWIYELNSSGQKKRIYSKWKSVSVLDFSEATVGVGAFAHDVLLYSFGRISYSDFEGAHYDRTAKVLITFTTKNGVKLKGECEFII